MNGLTIGGYEVEWLGDRYLVAPFHDSGVVHIQKKVKPRFGKERWETIFFSHIMLLQELANLATKPPLPAPNQIKPAKKEAGRE